MPSEYSFLDVAVLDAVRQRFAAGDAIAILSADLEQVIWANGPGAAMFGYPDIEAIIGASAQLPVIARRQIMATSGFPEIGSDRAIMVRLATGMTSRAVGFLASAVTMPDAEKAIMLAVPAAQTGSRSASEIAARAISGLTEDGHFIAFVDAGGNVEAASEGFSALGILPETLAALVADVAAESDRIVKRLVPGGTASYPAGLARLTEERHLLVVIDEDQLDDTAPAGEHPTQTIAETAPAGDAASQPEQGREAPTDEPSASQPAGDIAASQHEIADAIGQAPTAANSDQPAAERMPAQHDHWYFNAGEDGGEQAPRPAASGPEAPQEPAALEVQSTATPTTVSAIDRAAAPVRFVWRTDAEGKFSALSPEFADIVGKPAADVIGRRFRDVAATFGLDPSGEISGLLERRDTWSGRSVLWPVVGTDLKIPVDLAALPVYGRSRAFEGFRGFGVARASDAVVDPEAIGMALVPNSQAPATPEPQVIQPAPEQPNAEEPKTEDTQASDPFKGEVPALTIVPKQERRFADKVIRLAEHRQPANDKGLSTLERSAFREIGERLKKDSAPVEPPETETVEASAAETEAPVKASSDPMHSGVIPASGPENEPVEASDVDAEDERDLARLDGHADEAARDARSGMNVTGSLLDYAGQDDE
ncbi:PAS domain-containing sensor histidine kinase, partial [Mesorhizobium sp. M7A.T.Ca.TU.009.01.3.1]